MNKQIEEMAECIEPIINNEWVKMNDDFPSSEEIAKAFYVAGYRKVCRCKKCKYHTTHTCAITGIETMFCEYGVKPVPVKPTHYCGYGERRQK